MRKKEVFFQISKSTNKENNKMLNSMYTVIHIKLKTKLDSEIILLMIAPLDWFTC